MGQAMQRHRWWSKRWSPLCLRGLGCGLLPFVYIVLPLPGPWGLGLALYMCVWAVGLLCITRRTTGVRSVGDGLLMAAALSPILWFVWFIVWIAWFASDYDRFRVFY
jgi:hypothetical protein